MKKNYIILLAILILSAKVFSQTPVAFFDTDGTGNITMYNGIDGIFEEQVIDGIKAVIPVPLSPPSSSYLYFKISEELKSKINENAYVVITYNTDNEWANIGLQSNSINNPYLSSDGFYCLGKMGWSQSLGRLANFKAMGQMHGDCDLRLALRMKSAISRLEIYNEYPSHLNIPDIKEEFLEIIENISPKLGENMSYCLGCNASEDVAALYKTLGFTSVECYVTWETCERHGENMWDWTHWDRQLSTLERYNLKWVPLLIVGPAYSIPAWFRETDDHYPSMCVEHNIPSKVESLWNPNLPKYIDRFIKEFANRYKDTNTIESILLGIQGDFGESIYPAGSGGWTFDIPGEYHTHHGYWCNDPYAKEDFKKYIQKKYKNISNLNKAWHTSFKNFNDITFPFDNEESKLELISNFQTDITKLRHYLDFITWYRDSMNNLVDFWMKTTRKYFPNTQIYLGTGGYSHPELGVQFTEQSKISAKYKAGVRITNENSDFAHNFSYTRQVATPCKFYNTYFAFEPAGGEDIYGIPARIFNATTSGASQMFSYDGDIIRKDETIEQQQKYINNLYHIKNPIVPIAVWYPDINQSFFWAHYFDEIVPELRDYFDFDIIDDILLSDGALNKNKIMVIPYGNIMETESAKKIANWISKGGILYVTGVEKFKSVEGTDAPEKILFPDNSNKNIIGKGYSMRVKDYSELSENITNDLIKMNYPVFEIKSDKVYAVQISDKKILIYSKNYTDTNVEIKYQGKSYTVQAKAKSISEFSL